MPRTLAIIVSIPQSWCNKDVPCKQNWECDEGLSWLLAVMVLAPGKGYPTPSKQWLLSVILPLTPPGHPDTLGKHAMWNEESTVNNEESQTKGVSKKTRVASGRDVQLSTD